MTLILETYNELPSKRKEAGKGNVDLSFGGNMMQRSSQRDDGSDITLLSRVKRVRIRTQFYPP